MGTSHGRERVFKAPSASRQVTFHQLLVAARKTWLQDALREALRRTSPQAIKAQLLAYVPADVQQILASAGIRDEHVFPTPAVLESKPSLVGYYRLLLGVPRKGFYTSSTGMTALASMERRGTITEAQKKLLGAFCASMAVELASLVRQISPRVTRRDVKELPLITLGSMFQGANNVRIGEEAKQSVFLTVRDIVKRHIIRETASRLTLKNAAGRLVEIHFGSDPDIEIREHFGEALRNVVAIEIKGGTDVSNAHNRAGEAEKSHQKARSRDFRDFWTLIAGKTLDLGKLKRESPTTNSWFDVSEVLAREGPNWLEFQRRLAGAIGIPLA